MHLVSSQLDFYVKTRESSQAQLAGLRAQSEEADVEA